MSWTIQCQPRRNTCRTPRSVTATLAPPALPRPCGRRWRGYQALDFVVVIATVVSGMRSDGPGDEYEMHVDCRFSEDDSSSVPVTFSLTGLGCTQ